MRKIEIAQEVSVAPQTYWSRKAQALTPYVAGEQPKEHMIKLNTNENAYPPSPAVSEAVAEIAHYLRKYPAPDALPLREAVAEAFGVRSSQVFCGNGSDEVLAMCFLAFFAGMEEPVRTADITYSFYPVWADLFDATLERIPLLADYTVNIPAMCGAAGVILANPNAPTAIALSLEEVEQIVRETKGVCVIDEAYWGFGAQSAVELVEKYPNLVVVHTLSKSHSLAGLRVGFAIAQENMIGALETVKDSFNSYPVDMLAQAGACAAIEDTAYFEETSAKICAIRDWTAHELREMGYRVLPSAANFIFVQCANAAETYAALREKKILVRYFGDDPRTQDFLRVTIGNKEEMTAFLEAMEELKEDV